MVNYPWYEVIENDNQLHQGDIIHACPVIIPKNSLIAGQTVEADVYEYDVIVMNQTCDLTNNKIELVAVCVLWSLEELGSSGSHFAGNKGREELRRGYLAGYHLLNKCYLSGFEHDFYVADFRNIYGVPYNSLLSMVQTKPKRLRLLPPYREHLSQAFARFFMRVGLPADIPSFR